MLALRVSIVLLILSVPQHVAAGSVWIDADPACDLGMTDDVDDCWAIIAAIRSSSLHVVGVSTVFGNVQVEQATDSAKALLDVISLYEPGRAVPSVHQGAGRPTKHVTGIPPAVTELEIALTEGPLTILALGPLTNVALLLKHRPELIPRIEAVVAVAGQRPGQVFRVGNTPILHFHDLNVRKDPDAVEIVLRSGVPLYLIPFEVGRQIVITRRDLRVLEAQSSLDAWLSARSAPWLEFWEHTLGAQGFSPFDLLAAAFLVDPSQFTCQTIPAKLVRRRGLFVVRDTLEVSSSFEAQNIVRYCSGISNTMRGASIKLLDPE
jgi:pyrimidine-specific ribonucleoside hydrolase